MKGWKHRMLAVLMLIDLYPCRLLQSFRLSRRKPGSGPIFDRPEEEKKLGKNQGRCLEP